MKATAYSAGKRVTHAISFCAALLLRHAQAFVRVAKLCPPDMFLASPAIRGVLQARTRARSEHYNTKHTTGQHAKTALHDSENPWAQSDCLQRYHTTFWLRNDRRSKPHLTYVLLIATRLDIADYIRYDTVSNMLRTHRTGPPTARYIQRARQPFGSVIVPPRLLPP